MSIMEKFRSVSILSIVFLLIGIVFCAPPALCQGKVYRWKIQSAYPKGDVSMELLKDFAADINKQSNGRLLLSVFAAPELVSAEQLFDATSQGTIDMLHGLGAMWAGDVPVGDVEFGLPFEYRMPGKNFRESAIELRKLFYEHGMVELLREEYAKHGFYWLDMHTYGPGVILSTRSINTNSDFNGLRIIAEGSFKQFFNSLGASRSTVIDADTHTALKLGTVDAVQWDVGAITALKWYEVAPYWIKGGDNYQSVGHILVNLKRWNALPEDLKNVLQDSALGYWNKLIDQYDTELSKAKDIVKHGKLKVIVLDILCQAEQQAAARKIWNSVASKDPVSAKAIKMIKAWHQELRN
jgi:TRAP-type mannitol/chloroaromatic compound transport system substrate-binding protein